MTASSFHERSELVSYEFEYPGQDVIGLRALPGVGQAEIIVDRDGEDVRVGVYLNPEAAARAGLDLLVSLAARALAGEDVIEVWAQRVSDRQVFSVTYEGEAERVPIGSH